jgi:hypothetical protein
MLVPALQNSAPLCSTQEDTMIRLCVKAPLVALMALMALSAACVDVAPDPASDQEQSRVITADDTAGLDAKRRLALDVRTASYTIDPVAGPVDLRFVDVIAPNGERVSLEEELTRMMESSELTRDAFENFSIRAQGDQVEYQGFTSSELRAPKCYVCVCDEGECVCERVPCPTDPV